MMRPVTDVYDPEFTPFASSGRQHFGPEHEGLDLFVGEPWCGSKAGLVQQTKEHK